uniref:BHLH domain-containing protein n=1 Tax=Takifugu rubripes TaxID=31033 RepID=H2T0U1_TAKRU
RRERINRSLDNLKSLLLLPQVKEKQRSWKHTVLFLQKTRDKNRSEAGGGSQKDSFQEGFSDCMERAVRFLGPMGKGLCLRAVLDPSASARSSSSDFGSANWKNRSEVHPSSSSQLLSRSCKSLLHLWLHKPGSVPGPVAFRCVQNPGQSQRPLPSQQMRNGANKQNHLQSHPASRSLWRPWP